MTIEAWKVRRELQRIRLQLQAIPEFFYEPLLRWWHDRQRPNRLKVTEGHASAARKVAVYLLFQPRGVAESTVHTCQHLVANGYAPLIVSNAPLSAADRERLRGTSWRVVERPNFGYDFGGYRDGIWLLSQWHIQPQTLILMNDSVWFPVTENDRTIAQMEDMPAEFRGILKLGTDQESSLPRARQPFLGSFFLMFSARALQCSEFTGFWQTYRNTSNKYKTIRRGERRISYVMREAGFDAAAVFERSHFEQWLQGSTPATLRQVLDELVTLNPQTQAFIDAAAAAFDAKSPDQQARSTPMLRDVILRATAKSNLFASAPVTMLRDLNLPFVKKSPNPWNWKALNRINTYHYGSPEIIRLNNFFISELRNKLLKNQFK